MVLLEIWSEDHGVFDQGNLIFVIAALMWAIMSKFTSHSKRFGNTLSFSMWLHVITIVGLAFFVDYEEIIPELTGLETDKSTYTDYDTITIYVAVN